MAGFQRAVRRQAKLRLAIIGPAGSGKTFTALKLASYLAATTPTAGRSAVALIDTEFGSASKYAAPGEPDPEAGLFGFDTLQLHTFGPPDYVAAIKQAEQAGYEVVIIDSLSHAWVGKGGALELHDDATKRQKSGNSYVAWRDVTPLHNQLIEAMVQSKCHVIATMRSKTDYVQEKDGNGRTTVKKIGLAPVQRDGLEYEFDVTGDMDVDNNYLISKTRCPALSGKVFAKPGKELALTLRAWLDTGSPAPAAPPHADNGRAAPRITAGQIDELDGLVKESGYSWTEWTKWLRKNKHAGGATAIALADLDQTAVAPLREALQKAVEQRKAKEAAAAAQEIGDGLAEELERLLRESGRSWAEVREDLRKEYPELPEAAQTVDLTPGQATTLRLLLKVQPAKVG